MARDRLRPGAESGGDTGAGGGGAGPDEPTTLTPWVPNAAPAYGTPLPVVYGTARTPGRVVLETGNYITDQFFGGRISFDDMLHKSIRANSFRTHFDGFCKGAVIAFAEGTIEGFVSYWRGDDWLGNDATMLLPFSPTDVSAMAVQTQDGSSTTAWTALLPGQTSPTFWPPGWNSDGTLIFSSNEASHPNYQVPFFGTAHVRAFPAVYGTARNERPKLSAEVRGLCRASGGPAGLTDDANPADVLVSLLTATRFGAGWTAGDIEVDVGADGTAASSYRRYCQAMGFYVSRAITGGNYLEAVESLLEATDSIAVWSGGKLKIRPLGTTTVTANACTYTPYLGATAITADDLGKEPVEVERIASASIINAQSVRFAERSFQYKEATVEATLSADIAARGMVRGQLLANPWISRRQHAYDLASVLVARNNAIRARYRFRLGPRHGLLEAFDLLSITHPSLGSGAVTVRIASVDEDDRGQLRVEAVEYPLVVTVIAATPQAADGRTFSAISQVPASGISLGGRLEGIRDAALPLLQTWDRASLDKWVSQQGTTQTGLSLQSGGQAGGSVLRAVGYTWQEWGTNIPFDPSRLYKLRFRVRQTVDPTTGGKLIFAGLAGVAADGATMVNINGSNDHGSQHYGPSAVSQTVAAGWVEYTYYWQGVAATGTAGGATVQTAGKLHQSVRYVRPLFILNYDSWDGTAEVDLLELTEETLAGAGKTAADAAQADATAGIALATSRNRAFHQAAAPSNPTGGYALVAGDLWFSTDTSTNCPDSNCKGHTADANGDAQVGSYPHRALYWPHKWTGSAWVDTGGQQLIIASEIAAGAIIASKIAADALQTSNYTQDGNGYPTAGAKLDKSGTALKVAPANVQVGAWNLEEMFAAMAAANWMPFELPTASIWRKVVESTATGTRQGRLLAVSQTSTNAATSDNGGRTWTARTLPSGTWYSCGYSQSLGLFVVVGSNVAASSSDGVTWTSRTIPTGLYRDVHWSATAGAFVAVGDNSVCATSTNGTSWTARTIPTGYYEGVTYGGGMFVAVGHNSSANAPIVSTSTDGSSWTSQTVPGSGNASCLFSVAYGGGIFLAVGGDPVGPAASGAKCVTSTDGVTWTDQTIPAPIMYTGVAFGGGVFVAVGYDSNGRDRVSISAAGANWKTTSPGFNVSAQAVLYLGGFAAQRKAFLMCGTALSGVATDPAGGTSLTLTP